jgi:hypothetical protein
MTAAEDRAILGGLGALNPKTAFEKARLAESCGHQRVALFARRTSSAPSEKRNSLLLRIFLAIHAIQKRFSG